MPSKNKTIVKDLGINLKKRLILALTAIIVVVIVVSAFALAGSFQLSSIEDGNKPTSSPRPTPTVTPAEEVASKKPFYFGVTYCGNSTTEAKQLIDKVKNYTNLFVLQSGPLMEQQDASMEICDYAVNSGLDIIIYYSGSGLAGRYLPLINIAEDRWGSHFLGLYYNDEPGGKMLDSYSTLNDLTTGTSVNFWRDGSIHESINRNISSNERVFSNTEFSVSGEIEIQLHSTFSDFSYISNTTTYFTNGTISFSSSYRLANYTSGYEPEMWYQPDGIVQTENGTIVTGKGDISQFKPYQQVWDSRPFRNYSDTANLYVKSKNSLLSSIGNQSKVTLFTSDYALYWFDYQAGYDTVWAQLGWNNNVAQEIALVRGAANMQNKEWGTMIAWQSNTEPYLQSSDQMYNTMLQSYESGAKYVTVFNYAPNQNPSGVAVNATSNNDVGLLQDEHFAVMEKFWKDVVENPARTNNVTVEAALVLPNSYGWGMRHIGDKIWGYWGADSNSEQIWAQLQSKLAQCGAKLDIVYDDPAYPVAGKYANVYFWNQTS